jgi:single-stranded-DNA-specific exonuclease
MRCVIREPAPRAAWVLQQSGLDPVLAKLYATRGVTQALELDDGLAQLHKPADLKGAQAAAELLATAVREHKHICIVADYDCDGATACAVAIRGLRLLGAQHVQYLVPNRVQDGYGLTPSIADRVHALGADLLVTVDNGIASIDGVAHAKALGLQVLVTDHHLCAMPDEHGVVALPAADAIVNPNQPGCVFASKHMAGVGVMFYVLLVLRALLRSRGVFDANTQPKLDALLPLVALGTVADVVRLDANNRRLVSQGLKRLRAGHMPAGMAALFEVAARQPRKASGFDFGFALGPRINAAGRLSDMTLGIECLITDDAQLARELAGQLNAINTERRAVEQDMREQAQVAVQQLFEDQQDAPAGITVFDPDFHEGIIGIVAGRIKEQLHRPTFVFAPSGKDGDSDVLKGSGRSIAGFHLRDALDLLAKRHPGVLLRFGGHAMAAGCSVPEDRIAEFEEAFAQIASEWLDADALTQTLSTDGSLAAVDRRLDVAELIDAQVWGNGFDAPVFLDDFEVSSQRLVAEKHLGLKLRHNEQMLEAIWFGRTEPLPATARLAYRLQADEWQGQRRLKLLIQAQAS